MAPHETSAAATPLAEAADDQPPIIRRADLVAFALVSLLVITVVAVLFVARSLFMPIVAAFIIGTMLSSGAAFLTRFGLPRGLATTLTLACTLGVVALVLGLLSAPLIDLPARLPELNAQLRDKLQVFDRPLALWRELQVAIGGSPSEAAPALPKIEWVQPTLEFLSPTLTELLLFVVTLILFVASWPDLRRTLILTFASHGTRLQTLRILNAIEQHLGGYLLTVTGINVGLGIATGLISSLTHLPNPAGLGALAATMNYIPIIGPVVTFVILLLIGVISAPTLSAGLLPCAIFAVVAFLEGHFVTPTIIGRRLELNALAVFIAFSFWTWLWGPVGAFLASPMLIVALVLKEHLMPVQSPQLPEA